MSGMRGAPRMYRVLHRLLPVVLDRYLTFEVVGLDNVPAHSPVILAANHLSFIDSILLPLKVPRPVSFLGKVEYFDSWRTRWFVSATGVVPVHRVGGDGSRASLETGVRILREGGVLGVYPEGTRSPDGRLYRGKTGPVRIALTAGVPIVPCAIAGTREVMPEGRRLPHRGAVSVTYGEPLDLSAYAGLERDAAAVRTASDQVMDAIMRLSGQEYADVYAADVKAGAPAPATSSGPLAPRRASGE